MNVSGITSFNKNFDQVFMNNSFGAENFEPKTTFEKTLNEIKYNRLKGITSIDMNVSYITSNKPSSSSEHLKYDPMQWILLKSPGKSSQFTNHLSSVYPNGNTQLHILKWWFSLRSELYIFLFCHTFANTSQ